MENEETRAPEIEDAVPIPKRGKKVRYPALYTMEIGQSFFRPHHEGDALHYAAQHCRKTTGRKFTVRYPNTTTVRIWRTE